MMGEGQLKKQKKNKWLEKQQKIQCKTRKTQGWEIRTIPKPGWTHVILKGKKNPAPLLASVVCPNKKHLEISKSF